LLHVARDLLGRRALLLHRRSDRDGDLVDPADGFTDRFDRVHGAAGRALDRVAISIIGCANAHRQVLSNLKYELFELRM